MWGVLDIEYYLRAKFIFAFFGVQYSVDIHS